jgi:hypothetical protein
MTDEKYQCEFCGKEFARAKTLVDHLCTKKLRHIQKQDSNVRIGFQTWLFFRKYNKIRGDASYEKFCNDKLYNAFVRFGKHVIDIQAISPENFITFIIKNTVRIDDWVKDHVYEMYLREVSKKEPPEVSLERTILLMEQWALEHDKLWTDFFRELNTNVAVQWIKSGRISPWVLYHANTADELFKRMDDEQLTKIYETVNPKFWKLKFARQKEDVKFVKDTCDNAGI